MNDSSPATGNVRPTIAELEWILAAPDGIFKTSINPDGSVRAVPGPRFHEMFPFAPSAVGENETPECPKGQDALVAGPAANGASGFKPERCASEETLTSSKQDTCQSIRETLTPDESNRQHFAPSEKTGSGRNAIIEECAKVAMDMPLKSGEERHSYRWTDTYKSAAWDIAHAISALKNAAPQVAPSACQSDAGSAQAGQASPAVAAPVASSPNGAPTSTLEVTCGICGGNDHIERACPARSKREPHPEDFCQKCGRPNAVWFAPSDLWNKAVRAVGAPEILCPVCFIELAEAAGITPTAWKVAPEEHETRVAPSETTMSDKERYARFGTLLPLGERPKETDAEIIARSTAAMPSRVTDEMVTRFLGWKLPEDFHPDAGISFQPYFNVEWNAKHGKPPQRHEPIGTNLLNADQARAMLEHVLAVAPSSTAGKPAIRSMMHATDFLPHGRWIVEFEDGTQREFEHFSDFGVFIMERARNATSSSTGEPSEVPCARCGGHVVEFVVPSDVWNSVVRLDGKEGDDEYLCETCYRNAVTAWVRSSRSARGDTK